MKAKYMIQEGKIMKVEEGFDKKETEEIMKVIQKCFEEKGNDALRKNDVLNKYLGKLSFEVDASDIKIGDWESHGYDRQMKSAKVILQGKVIGYLSNF